MNFQEEFNKNVRYLSALFMDLSDPRRLNHYCGHAELKQQTNYICNLLNGKYILVRNCIYKIDNAKIFELSNGGSIMKFIFDGTVVSDNSFNGAYIENNIYIDLCKDVIVSDSYETLKLYLEGIDNKKNLFDQIDFYESKYKGKFLGFAAINKVGKIGYLFEAEDGNACTIVINNDFPHCDQMPYSKNISIYYDRLSDCDFAFKDFLRRLEFSDFSNFEYENEAKLIFRLRNINTYYLY